MSLEQVVSSVVWGMISGAVVVFVLSRVLRRPRGPVRPLPFLRDQRPWILLVRPDDAKDDPFVITVKRLAYQYGVPVHESTPDKSPYPLPRHVSAVVFQGRFLWFTKNTFDKDLFTFSLSAAKEHWDNYLYTYRQSLRRSTVLLTPGLFATHGAEFPDSYLSVAFFDPDDYTVSDDGSIETDSVGLPYHPYMHEGLNRVGSAVRDLRSLSPVCDFVYVTRPRHVEESM